MSRVSRPPPRPVPAARPCVLCGPAPVGLSGKHKTFFTVPFTCRTLAFQTDKHTQGFSPPFTRTRVRVRVTSGRHASRVKTPRENSRDAIIDRGASREAEGASDDVRGLPARA